jgi:hypothetical protein
MPLYMDRHFVEGATRSAVAHAHELDLALQEKYKVQFLTYWFDEARCTAFCLIVLLTKRPFRRRIMKLMDWSLTKSLRLIPVLCRPSWAESATLLQWIPHPEKRERLSGHHVYRFERFHSDDHDVGGYQGAPFAPYPQRANAQCTQGSPRA